MRTSSDAASRLNGVVILGSLMEAARTRLLIDKLNSRWYYGRPPTAAVPQAKILRFRTPLDTCGRRARRSAPSASPKKILRFRGQFDHFGAGCGGCGGLGRGCGCEALRARWMWMCGVPRAISAGCVWALRHPRSPTRVGALPLPGRAFEIHEHHRRQRPHLHRSPRR